MLKVIGSPEETCGIIQVTEFKGLQEHIAGDLYDTKRNVTKCNEVLPNVSKYNEMCEDDSQ